MPVAARMRKRVPPAESVSILTKAAPPCGSGWLRAFLVATVLTACASGLVVQELQGRVVRVADGDTVTVLDQAKVQHRIRLAGIDAPERGQPCGERAKDHLSSVVAGRQVVVAWDKRDRYGRMVGKVLLDGRDVNLAMVQAGLAWHYKAYALEQSEEDRLTYSRAEDSARRSRTGLWVDPHPMAPWDWRRR